VEGLFNPLSILLHVINAIILLVALYFLLLKPVRKFMNARSEKMEAHLLSITAAEHEAQQRIVDAREVITEARKTAADTVAKGVIQAHEQAQKILDEAHHNAAFIMKQANIDADSMRKKARDEMRDEVANLGLALASRLLQREVNQKDHDQLVDEFLKKVV